MAVKRKKSTIKTVKKDLRGRDFLSVEDFTSSQINRVFALAASMKRRPASYRKRLDGKMMALIFEKPSLRTRTTFTIGMKQKSIIKTLAK